MVCADHGPRGLVYASSEWLRCAGVGWTGATTWLERAWAPESASEVVQLVLVGGASARTEVVGGRRPRRPSPLVERSMTSLASLMTGSRG